LLGALVEDVEAATATVPVAHLAARAGEETWH
jgi:hypothetical protein